MHSVFHMSMLRKCVSDVSQILPVQPEGLQQDLSMEENAVQIRDRKEQVRRNKVIPLVLLQWQHHGVKEATWEWEEDMYSRYPYLFH